MYISQFLRYWMVLQYHNNSAQGHPGVFKTVKLLSQNYYFPRIRKKIKRYINKHQNCLLNKHTIYAFYNYIQYIRIANCLWQNIVIDFITKLPESKNTIIKIKYNHILVIVNKLTKYIYLILYNERSTA